MKKMRQVVDPNTKEWYGLDQDNMVWTFSDDMRVALCITITPELKKEGLLAKLRRQIQEWRKGKQAIYSEKIEEVFRAEKEFGSLDTDSLKMLAKELKIHDIEIL